MPSQYGEDDAIARFTANLPAERRRFLDIGAWDPIEFSNSRALYEKGWHGVIVEPSPGALVRQIAAYGKDPNVEIVALAVGMVAGGFGSILEFQTTDDCVGTMDPEHFAKWKGSATFTGRIFTQVVPLNDILQRFGTGFGFVNIDAEGVSADIFLEALKIGLEPACYCVEFDDRLPELCAAATDRGYVLGYSNSTNAVFRRDA